MKMKKYLPTIVIILICCISIICFSGSIQSSQRTYEVQPNLTIPEYKTDIDRVVDAYERGLDRYMDLTERNLTGMGSDLETIITKLDSIDAKLTELAAKTARIEKTLGIEVNTTIQTTDAKSKTEGRK
jgi:hypothetical protein